MLDLDAWALLLASVPAGLAAGVPPRFVAAPDLLTDAEAVAQSRRAAGERLQALGLADAAGRLTDAAAGVVGAWRAAAVTVSARAWAGDRTVLVEAAAGPGSVVALTRLVRVDDETDPVERWRRAEPGRRVQPGLGVEVSVLPADRLLEPLWRVVPPVMRNAVPPPDGVPVEASGVPVASLEVTVRSSGVARATADTGWLSHGTWVSTPGGLFAVQPSAQPPVPGGSQPGPDAARLVATDGRGLLADLLRTLAAAVRGAVQPAASGSGGPGE